MDLQSYENSDAASDNTADSGNNAAASSGGESSNDETDDDSFLANSSSDWEHSVETSDLDSTEESSIENEVEVRERADSLFYIVYRILTI